MRAGRIVILGIGCTLYSDQGFGVSIVQALEHAYRFPPEVLLADGGLIGISLTGTIAQADHVIAVDAITFGGKPGDICRLEGTAILERLKVKNHVQQVDFLEALSHCQVLDHPPQAVLLGIQPQDNDTLACALTPLLQQRCDTMLARVLAELDRLGVAYDKKEDFIPCV
ncbi:MAG: hypothetical protein VR64_24585 [Desulfatitalea sp. BRH_c12]|nr:MAG: hypothetical protein VR64_24585 [Desulfatitalea sp. BRH_c12]